jgi:hypothetical protein
MDRSVALNLIQHTASRHLTMLHLMQPLTGDSPRFSLNRRVPNLPEHREGLWHDRRVAFWQDRKFGWEY